MGLTSTDVRADGVLPRELSDGKVKVQYGPGRIGDYISGTAYFVEYQFDNQASQTLRIGDRFRLHCVLLSGPSEEPCDSFDLMTTLGRPGLPLAVDWAILNNTWGLAWNAPIRTSGGVLDGRFTKCGVDSLRLYAFQLSIADLDTSGRTQVTREEKVIQRAILKLRGGDGGDVAEELKPLLGKLGKNDLFRALYAAALAGAGSCLEYGRQCEVLANRGYWGPSFSREQQESYCSKWQKQPYTLR